MDGCYDFIMIYELSYVVNCVLTKCRTKYAWAKRRFQAKDDARQFIIQSGIYHDDVGISVYLSLIVLMPECWPILIRIHLDFEIKSNAFKIKKIFI